MNNERYYKLEEILNKYINNEGIARVRLAYSLCEKYHKNQVRKSGEPYINHLLEVAIILATTKASSDTIIIGLLHDILEDTDIKKEVISTMFGDMVYKSIASLTKIKKSNETSDDYLKRLIIGMTENRDIILIKLADRLHNMRTLSYVSSEKQKRISKETRSIYIPIAARLGLHWLKSELEELCFYYLQREEYNKIKLLKDNDGRRSKEFLDEFMSELKDTLSGKEAKIISIYGREKDLYSIYKKMEFKGKEYNELIDVIAVRIVTTNVVECYKIFGLLTELYGRIPSRTKDYISNPKESFYEAIHTGVIYKKTPIEVQIMTSEMEVKTKIGLSSHVSYKEKHTKMLKSNNFLDYIMEYTNTLGAKKIAEDFIGDIKSDFLSSVITVLTPNGEKVDIKKGSTALDFAFKIHTELGLHSSYAKIDGVWAPLSRVLSGGNIVEIIKDDHKIVPLKSLEWVRTKKAADLIREAYVNNESISSNLEITYGRQIFDDYLRNNQEYSEIINERYISKYLKLLKFEKIDDFYISLARKETKLSDILSVFRKNDRTFKKLEKNYRRDLSLSKVFEVDKQMNLNLNIDRLSYKIDDCSPIYGERIVGELIPTLIKKERKILVHRSNCYKVISGKEQKPASFVKINWSDQRGIYKSVLTLEIEATDRKELVKDVIGIAYSSGSTIQYIESKFFDDDEKVKITLKLKVRDAKHFKKVLFLFNKLVDLDKIRRV